MKKHLILVKHSLPEVVESLPAAEWRLSDEGRARARRLAERLDRFRPEVLLSSTEPKAKETAEFIASIRQLELCSLDGLREHHRDQVPFLAPGQFEASVHEFFRRPDRLVFGNETADQAHVRFSEALHSILKAHVDETVAVVAHGTVISLFVSRRVGISDFLLWSELGLPSFLVMDLESKTLVARENNV